MFYINKKIRKNLDSMTDQDLLDFHYDYNVDMSEAFSSVYVRPSDYPRFKNRDKYPLHIASWNELSKYITERGLCN